MDTNQSKTAVPPSHLEELAKFEAVLRMACEKGASDLHLKAGLPPIVRVNGKLYYLGEDGEARLTQNQLQAFSYALMNSRQVVKYENGEEVDLGYELSGAGRFRINICQQRSNARLVCRYIPDNIPTIDGLGLPAVLTTLAESKRGLILVTGATGSGKSTTLAALIDQIARSRSCHIITIEDPIEFVFRDRKSIVTQREIGLDTFDFPKALKYALRQDPDVILVGEMRDLETIQMALNAAETGHLVLSTLHTVDAPETINRILGMIPPEAQASARAQLASVLIGVVSQRLLRRKDGQGRIPAVEILLKNARVAELIMDQTRTRDLSKAISDSQNMGMQSFDQSMMQLVQQGFITQEEALSNSSNARDFQLRLSGVVTGDWREKTEASVSIRGGTGAIELEKVENTKKKRRGGF